MQEKWNLDANRINFIKINLKWITLNAKCNTIKPLADYIGENLVDLEYSDDFLDATPKA